MDEEYTEITELQKSECLEAYIKWFQTEAPFQGPSDIGNKQFLKINLGAYDYDLETTKKVVTNYYRMKSLHPRLLKPLNFQEESAFELFDQCTVSCDVSRGKCDFPLVFTMNRSRISDIYDATRLQIHVSLVAWLESLTFQRKKVISVLDISDASYSYLLQMTPTYVDEMLECTQTTDDNLAQCHIINTGMILGALMEAARLGLPTAVNDCLYIHSGSWECLSDYIPPESLPEEYGGTCGTLADHKETMRGLLLKWNDYMMELDKYEWKTPTPSFISAINSEDECQ